MGGDQPFQPIGVSLFLLANGVSEVRLFLQRQPLQVSVHENVDNCLPDHLALLVSQNIPSPGVGLEYVRSIRSNSDPAPIDLTSQKVSASQRFDKTVLASDQIVGQVNVARHLSSNAVKLTGQLRCAALGHARGGQRELPA